MHASLEDSHLELSSAQHTSQLLWTSTFHPALSTHKPIAALETTLVTHGFPYLANYTHTSDLEDIVRSMVHTNNYWDHRRTHSPPHRARRHPRHLNVQHPLCSQNFLLPRRLLLAFQNGPFLPCTTPAELFLASFDLNLFCPTKLPSTPSTISKTC
ncbi:uncharacterized protein EV420DRAFT_235783 [Desarmillaria tabescens]|uniref:Uncharacterized protein n=1 Tax=Armillaria tabescens TaxID=1929756 RepID=A0AA39J7G5_ARMTA|nr:uncharacterized protein EV420DRAFT_235783 [Desarmillaria tabescens]KAK0436631.1 hypothetical protein EV420DRAFT_235783 [Desarmillaria tabescens]